MIFYEVYKSTTIVKNNIKFVVKFATKVDVTQLLYPRLIIFDFFLGGVYKNKRKSINTNVKKKHEYKQY